MSVITERIGTQRIWRELGALRAFLLRDVDLTKRYLLWDVVWLVYNLINAFIIGLIGISSGATPDYTGGQPYVFYLLIGAIMWSYLSALFIIVAEAIAWERWEGTLEYTFMAPVHRLTHLIGVCGFATLYGIARIIIMLLLLVWAFHLDLSQANLPAALLALVVGSFAMIGLGLLGAVLPLLSPEKGAQATHIVLAMILLVSGVYYPITVLPEWAQIVAKASPAYWALIAQRRALLDGVPIGGMWEVLGALALTGLVSISLGYWCFSLAERYAKRVGLLKRSG
jgi:ABC-2 type transport system permease protein